jgi:hypothetical protein
MSMADGLDAALGRRTVLASAIALFGFGGRALAYDEIEMVDLKVVDRATDRELPLWRHDGRLFVAGEQGERYSLRITNHTPGRVLAVMSVDGVNIITGETARHDQRGYVLPPYGSYDLTGWRKSNSEVAAFAFTALPNAYAALTGRPGDIGLIGMAVFNERFRPRITPLDVTPERRSELDRPSAKTGLDPAVIAGARIARRDYSAAPPPLPIPPVDKPIAAPESRVASRPAPREDEKLGTEHGALERSLVNIVRFERATPYPQFVQEIAYDSQANLIRIGVIPPSRPGRPPRPFTDGSGFVPDPPRP